MLERLIELEDSIKGTVALINKEILVLRPTDWVLIKDLSQVLKPLENVTKVVSGKIHHRFFGDSCSKWSH